MIEIEINNLSIEIDTEAEHVFFIAPNYEERSIGFLNHILKLTIVKQITVVVLKLQSQNYKIDILDDLKVNMYNYAIEKLNEIKKLKNIKIHLKELAYPDRYTIKAIEHLKRDYVKEDKHVIFDFSCLPKAVILDVCKTFFSKGACKKFSFTYSSPQSYPKIRHPQAIGEMKGILTHKPISRLLEEYENGTLINFPSDLGYSGQLISDQVAKYTDFEQYLFIYMRRRSPLHSFDAMAGNSNLLSEAHREWRNNIINHFSIQDGYRKLRDIIENIKSKVGTNTKGYLVLLAPFGPKPLIVGCFLMSEILTNSGIDIEIVQESSFQYSSVYSIGLDKTYLFKIDLTNQE